MDGVSGFLVPERDVDALAERLVYLVEHPEICQEMGVCGRQHVVENFDLHKLNWDLVALYRQAISRFRDETPGQHGAN